MRAPRGAPVTLSGRDALLEAAEELFAEKGLDGVGLREVCAKAGVNLATPAYHFGSKEGLYRAVLERLVARAFGALGPLPERPEETPAERAGDELREMVQRIFRMFRSNPRIARLTLRRALDRDTSAEQAVVGPAVAEVARRLRGLLRRAGGRAPTEDAEVVALSIAAMLLAPFIAEGLVKGFYGAGLEDEPVARRVERALGWCTARLLGVELHAGKRRKR